MAWKMKALDDRSLLRRLREQHQAGDLDGEWEAKSDFQLLRESQPQELAQVLYCGCQVLLWTVLRVPWQVAFTLGCLMAILLWFSFLRLFRSERLRSQIEDELMEVSDSNSRAINVETQMSPSNFKRLKKFRKWRSDLEGDESDFRLLRGHQRLLLKTTFPVFLLAFHLLVRSEGLVPIYTLVVTLIFGFLVYWRIKVVEKCRMELEDVLVTQRQEEVKMAQYKVS